MMSARPIARVACPMMTISGKIVEGHPGVIDITQSIAAKVIVQK